MEESTPKTDQPGTEERDPDWLTAEEEAELEQEMFHLGTTKYGLDEATAREWARSIVRGTDVNE